MVTIKLPDETAAALEAKAALIGLGLPEYLAQIAGSSDSTSKPELSVEEKLKRWHELIASMPPNDRPVDDSRESIYD
jgi:hypothetical protein